MVTVGRAGGGGGGHARGERGVGNGVGGVSGNASGSGGTTPVWGHGVVIRNAWGDFAQRGMVFAGGGAFGAGRVEG